MVHFHRATKQQRNLRAALFGPSGSGKTFTALRIAHGLGGAIAVVDTEHASSSIYADRFTFDAAPLERPRIEDYCQAVEAAAEARYDVLVIDSLSHGWQELLEEIDKLAKAKYRGNTWSAWAEGTPKQKRLVDALLRYPGHVLATMRSRTEWSQQKDEKSGKVQPVRVGLTPEQGKGIEYEFDLLLELSVDHIASVLKDRTGRYQDELLERPGEDLGRALGEWLAQGEKPAAPAAPASRAGAEARDTTDTSSGADETPGAGRAGAKRAPPTKAQIRDAFRARGIGDEAMGSFVAEHCRACGAGSFSDLSAHQKRTLLEAIESGDYDDPFNRSPAQTQDDGTRPEPSLAEQVVTRYADRHGLPPEDAERFLMPEIERRFGAGARLDRMAESRLAELRDAVERGELDSEGAHA